LQKRVCSVTACGKTTQAILVPEASFVTEKIEFINFAADGSE
jgi:hypothetical protein